ncbi:glycosyltransferase family 4 protein [bacterium]|nr:glycosyltransferase family 4 protein [bacterium]
MGKINVGLDVTSWLYGRGVSNYTANLAGALAARRDVELQLYACAGRHVAFFQKKWAEIFSVPLPAYCWQKWPVELNYHWWHHVGINPVGPLLPGVQVFHSWDYQQPPDRDLPLVSTIHDVAMVKNKTRVHPRIWRHHQESWEILKQRRAHIIAVSHSDKHDIVELLDFPEQRVHVVYEALPAQNVVAKDYISERRLARLRAKLRIDRDYILFVGTREPRKNLARLIEAWQPLSGSYDLVLAGAPGWEEPDYTDPCIRVVDQPEKNDLALLYAGAAALAFVSLDEGFGLPILEAYYYGVPVVTSVHTACEEVAGAAAVLVNPESVNAITLGLQKVLAETPAQKRARVAAGRSQLKKFAWKKAAAETVAVYRQALEEADE